MGKSIRYNGQKQKLVITDENGRKNTFKGKLAALMMKKLMKDDEKSGASTEIKIKRTVNR
jgi:hypothetical protein